MTQKYKKNNSPAIQNGIFSCFPDVLQPNLSDFPDVSQPDLSGFPDVFWFRYGGGMGQHVWRFKKNGRPASEVAHTGYVENISCFRG